MEVVAGLPDGGAELCQSPLGTRQIDGAWKKTEVRIIRKPRREIRNEIRETIKGKKGRRQIGLIKVEMKPLLHSGDSDVCRPARRGFAGAAVLSADIQPAEHWHGKKKRPS